MFNKFIKEIVKEAGNLVLTKFNAAQVEYTKEDPGEVVTQVDLEVNEMIINRIKEQFPEHGILSEEYESYQTGAEYLWIIDPLDGTRNFATGTPLFGIMLGVAHNQVMQAAAIYNPYNKELVFAEKGKGAFKNGEQIRCANTKSFKHSFGCGSINYKPAKKNLYQKLLDTSMDSPYWASGFGSTAISAIYVADGRRDWLIHTEANDWDYAIPALILSEAGCLVTDTDGKEWQLGSKELIAANSEIHRQLMNVLSG